MNGTVETMSLHENILLRPENLVASAESETLSRIVIVQDKPDSLEWVTFEANHLMYQLAQEAVTNATDNYQKSIQAKVNPGCINVTVEEGTVTVYNEGLAMNCDWIEEKKMYNPHLAMFTLLSSTNYKKDETSTTGGRNGVGGTCCSIFSTTSTVTIRNAKSGILYTQTTKDNMRTVEPATVSKTDKKGSSSFKFSYTLDFDTVCNHKKETGVQVPNAYSNEQIRWLGWLVMQAAASTGAPITFNGHLYRFPTIKQFGDLVIRSLIPTEPDGKRSGSKDIATKPIVLLDKEFQTQVAVYDTPNKGGRYAFCNGIPNTKGGSHVDKVVEGKLLPIFKKLAPKSDCTAGKLKRHITVFVSCRIPVDTVSYDGQRKETLKAKGYTFTLTKTEKETIRSHVAGWAALDAINSMQENKIIKGMEVTGKNYYSSTKACTEAKFAGKKGYSCKLIICEGNSTVDAIVKGIDTNLIGVLPVRGKILNASKSTKNEGDVVDKKYMNKINMNIMKAIGLVKDRDYTLDQTIETLRYKQVYIMTDADPDGDHIKILIYNFFRNMFPSLLKRKDFLTVWSTPLVRVPRSRGNQDLFFFDMTSYQAWAKSEEAPAKHQATYFKGLGSNGDQDIEFMHKNMDKKSHTYDEYTENMMALSMDKGYENDRKKWISAYMRGLTEKVPFAPGSMSNFIVETMMRYNIKTVERHIPSIMDGMKSCQRKIYWTFLNSTTVGKHRSNLLMIGEVMSMTKYKHGETSLYGTIASMISTFTGLNNYPLLEGRGQFGSTATPKPAAARYTSCAISKFGKHMMPEEWNVLLEYNFDEKQIEPKYVYCPLPLFALNGCKSMAVAWRTTFPCYNLDQLVSFIKVYLINRLSKETVSYVAPDPHFAHYNGIVRKVKSDTKSAGHYWVTEGSFTVSKTGKEVVITGFPVTMTCDVYLKKLEKKVLKYKTENKTLEYKNIVQTEITKTGKGLNIKPNIEIAGHQAPITLDTLGLRSRVEDKNIVLLDEEGNVLEYNTITDALVAWCDKMYSKYEMLKQAQVEKLTKTLTQLYSKKIFISDIREDRFSLGTLKGKTATEMKAHLCSLGYLEEFASITILQTGDEALANLIQLITDTETQLVYYRNRSVASIWLKQMDDLLVHMK